MVESQNSSDEITLSLIELTYVARLLGADMLLGIGDPFLGWLTEEIEDAWEEAKASLLEKGFIQERPDGGVIMDVIVGAAVGTCAFPKASFFAFKKPDSSEIDLRVFHLSDPLSIAQTAPKDEKDDVTLTIHEGTATAVERIVELIGLNGGVKSAEGSWATSMEMLWKLMDAKAKDVPGILYGQEMPDSLSSALTYTLKSSHDYASLMGLQVVDNAWKLKGLCFISNGDYLWKVSPDMESEEVKAVVETTDSEKAEQDITQLIEGMLADA